ncbi:MAG: 30S ribosomal protein S7 [Candidatus Dadabacteria bacterium]|nr:MAG: 30S ribosomal protein S7 [Candidatus Dadabacteria bacterium]
MTRKKRDFSREVLPDPKYGEVMITRTINRIMQRGKKALAERAMYEALDIVEKKTNKDPVEVFFTAIGNIKPSVEVRSRRVGGATYQVPTEVRQRRQETLAIRWLVQAMNARSERRLADRLANEILDAANNRGGAVKKREDTHKMAEANKAFAHFRW